MNPIILACLLALASLPAAASQREPVKVRVGDGTGVTVRTAAGVCGNDAECNDGVFCNGAERCAPRDPKAFPNGCVAGAPPCRIGEQCLENENRCRVGPCDVPDADGDGHAAIACGGDDCDDSDPDRNPSRTEICDARGNDEDCDVSTVGDTDLDGDGYIDARCL